MTPHLQSIIRRMSDAELILYAQLGGTFPRDMVARVARLVQSAARQEDNLGDPNPEPMFRIEAA